MPTGFITAPERMWPPISADFSTTVTERCGAFCFSRMAAARPERAGPDDDDVGLEDFAVPASAKDGPNQLMAGWWQAGGNRLRAVT